MKKYYIIKMQQKLTAEEEKNFLNNFLIELVEEKSLTPNTYIINKKVAVFKFQKYCIQNCAVYDGKLGNLFERNNFFVQPAAKKSDREFAFNLTKVDNLIWTTPRIIKNLKKKDEKQQIRYFLNKMCNKNYIDSTGLIWRNTAIDEFTEFRKETNISSMVKLGTLLERNGFLRTCGYDENHLRNKKKTNQHYEINLKALKNFNNSISENDSGIYDNGSDILLSSDDSEKSKSELSIIEPEQHKYDETSERELIFYKRYKQKINENFSPSNMGCIICQKNFSTRIEFITHIENDHLDVINKNNENISDSLPYYFKISFFASTRTHILKFKIFSHIENVIIFNIYTIKSGRFEILEYMDEKNFYVDQHLFSIGIKQPVYVLFKVDNNLDVFEIEEHHFLLSEELPDVQILLKSLKVANRMELPSDMKKLREYAPEQHIVMYSKSGYCDNDLQKINGQFSAYVQDVRKELTPNNFIEVFHNLLQMEDQFIINNYSQFDQNKVLLNCFKNEFSIELSPPKSLKTKLEEVVKPFDDVIIIFLKKIRDRSFIKGTIRKVYGNTITFEARNTGINSKLVVNVKFIPSRFTMRYQYRALEVISPDLKDILFPLINYNKYLSDITFSNILNKSIKNNPEQMEAVRNIVQPPNKTIPYIIFGPPGTGKTTVLVESILQLMLSDVKNRILLTAGSNAACNEIGKRLVLKLHEIKPNEVHLLRIFSGAAESQSEILQESDPLLFEASNHVYNDHFYPSLDTLSEYKIIVCTLAVIGRYSLSGLSSDYFSHVFIDECAASTEPEALVGICKVLSNKSHLILSGDTKQLGAVLFCNKAKQLGLEKSLMERLLERNCYKINKNGEYDRSIQTRLVRNYRTHECIISLLNNLYYENTLKACASEELTHWVLGWEKLPNKKFPMIFHNVRGQCVIDSGETSSYNLKELNIVMKYVKDMKRYGINGRKIKESDIGIISPYRKQYTKIKQELNNLKLNTIETGSVEIFQGKEKPIIIISMVKSYCNVGFLKNDKRINVMLSRPQALLILIGNAVTLSQIDAFERVIRTCKENKSFIE